MEGRENRRRMGEWKVDGKKGEEKKERGWKEGGWKEDGRKGEKEMVRRVRVLERCLLRFTCDALASSRGRPLNPNDREQQ